MHTPLEFLMCVRRRRKRVVGKQVCEDRVAHSDEGVVREGRRFVHAVSFVKHLWFRRLSEQLMWWLLVMEKDFVLKRETLDGSKRLGHVVVSLVFLNVCDH